MKLFRRFICKYLRIWCEKKEYPVFTPVLNYLRSEDETWLEHLIDKHRILNGKPVVNKELQHYRTAAKRINTMIGSKPSHRYIVRDTQELRKYGFTVAENIAYKFYSEEGALSSWARSTKHNKVLLGDWDYMGVRIKENYQGYKYYCLIFSRGAKNR